MKHKYDGLPVEQIQLNARESLGALDYGRQMIGVGGANRMPVPESIRPRVKALGHRMVRVFLQEYFFIYPEHGVFDWTRLDAFMDSLEQMGVKVLASICIKPKPLYPKVDPTVFMPNDAEEWKRVIRELVRRYSVERPLVSHWGVANEINIGENGGCPHEIKDPKDYFAFYQLTSQAILEAFPQGKVGGPSVAGFDYDYLEQFVELCRANGAPLDFISYNIYSGRPADHADAARKAKALAQRYGREVEVYQTELNTSFPQAYIEEAAYSGRYAASLAAVLMDLNETPISGSFQFDMYDAWVDPDDFERFYSITPFMLRHWNEIPHRFGLFDLDGRVRPQFYVYQMLGRMRGERLRAQSTSPLIRAAASRERGAYRLMAVNYGEEDGGDRVAGIRMSGIERGLYRLEVFRIDDGAHYDQARLIPTESRLTYALSEFSIQVLLPEDSVSLIQLTPQKAD